MVCVGYLPWLGEHARFRSPSCSRLVFSGMGAVVAVRVRFVEEIIRESTYTFTSCS